MDHERPISRHGLDHAFNVRSLNGGIKRRDKIVEFWINRGAEFDTSADSPAGR
jgi:hypothetical protein